MRQLLPCVVLLVIGVSLDAFAQDVVPRGNPFAIATKAGENAPGGRPGIASDGNNFLTVWLDSRNSATHARDPYAARVTRDGVVLDPNGIRLSTGVTNAEYPSVAFDGTHYVVVWTSPIAVGSRSEIYGTIVAADGTVVAADIPITTDGFPLNRVVSIAHDGTNFLVAWRTQSTSQIRATRVAKNNNTLTSLDGTGGFLVSATPGGFYPSVTFGSGQYLVVWYGGGAVSLDIFAARVSTAGVVLDPTAIVVSNHPATEDHPTVAASGSNYLVVYHNREVEDAYRNSAAFAARVSAAGAVLDTTPIQLTNEVTSDAIMPVVFDGTNYVVVMQPAIPQNARYHDLVGRRISPAGALVDAVPFPIAASFMSQGWLPLFGYANNRYLVAFNDFTRLHLCPGICVAGQILEKLPAPPAPPALPPPPAPPALDGVWEASPFSNDRLAIHSVDALDDTKAFAGTENSYQLYYESSTWQNWIGSLVGTDFAMWANAPNDVTAVGWGLGPKRFDGTSWAWGNVDAQRGTAQLAQAYWSSGRNNGFMVGTQGRAIHFDGANWTAPATGTVLDLFDVWGTSTSNVFAVGERGTVLRWNGGAWSAVANVPTRQNLNAVWGTGPTNVFVVGDYGTILHFNGVTWTTHASGTTKHFSGVAGLSATEIYAVGFGGTILRYDGATWHSETSGTTTNLLDVAVGGNTVWAVGDFGVIRKKFVTPNPCTRSLSQPTLTVAATGATSSVTFTTNCTWRAWSNASWIVLSSSSNGTGDATITVSVGTNPGTTSRTGTAIVGGQTLTVTQNGVEPTCAFSLTPTSASHGAAAATGNVTLTASAAACNWTAQSNATWLTITTPLEGAGSAVVNYSVAAHGGVTQRTGTLTIAGFTFTITQAGVVPTLLAPTSLAASVAGNTVTATWTMPPGSISPTGFVIEGGLSPGAVIGSLPTGSTGLAFTFSAPTGLFFIRVHSIAGASRSAASNEIRIAVNVPLPPAAPTNLVGEAFGSQLRLAWRNSFQEGTPTNIRLDVSGDVTVSMSLPVSESFTFSGVPPGTYSFTMRALNASGVSAASNPITLTFPAACVVPSTPIDVVVARAANVVTVSWNAPAAGPTPTGYQVNVTGTVSLTVPTAQLSLSGAAGPGTYAITVVATHPCGASAPSVTQTIVVP